MGTRGPIAKGSQPSRSKFKCPVDNCLIVMRGDIFLHHFGNPAPNRDLKLYDMNEIIHGYVLSVILTKFRINANIQLWQSFSISNFEIGIVSNFLQYINPW